MPQTFQIPLGATKVVTLSPIVIEAGQPDKPGALQVPPVPSWFGFDPTVISVTPAADGLTAAITALKGSSTTPVNNSAQNSNNVNILGSFNIETGPGPANGFSYSIS